MLKDSIVILCDKDENFDFTNLLDSQYGILTAHTEDEAWHTLDTNSTPVAILIDIKGQGDKNYILAKKISSDIRYKDTPILFICSDLEPEKKDVAYDNRKFPRLYRPLNLTSILHEIDKQVSKNQTESELKGHTTVDPLTELLKRDHFTIAATKQIAIVKEKNKKISFTMLALDNFSAISQEIGSEYSDHMLKDFAAICKKHLRPYDLIARYQEHRLVASFYDCTKDQAIQVIQRISDDVKNQSFECDGKQVSTTCSCGIAEILELSTENPESVLPDVLTIAYQRLEFATHKGGDTIES